MYVQTANGFTKIIGQIAEFTRTGSKLVSGVTAGIKTHKANIQLPGPHAQTIVCPQPVFYFIPPKQEAAVGVNAGDFILIRLEEKPQRRQFEIAAAGLFRASAGISLTHQIQILRSEPMPGVYKIMPAMELNKGEYALYLARGEGMAAYVYDFGVPQAPAVPVVQGSSAHHTADVSEFKPRRSVDNASGSSDPAGASATAAPARARTPAVGSGKGSSTPAAAVTVPAVPVEGTDTITHGGVLGVTGADWEQGGVRSVEIIDVADASSGQLAGLHRGNVITDINGVPVRSTQVMARVLAQLEPGSRVSIAYLYKSNLGWMPQETLAILGK
jgi:hypothetical protein